MFNFFLLEYYTFTIFPLSLTLQLLPSLLLPLKFMIGEPIPVAKFHQKFAVWILLAASPNCLSWLSKSILEWLCFLSLPSM